MPRDTMRPGTRPLGNAEGYARGVSELRGFLGPLLNSSEPPKNPPESRWVHSDDDDTRLDFAGAEQLTQIFRVAGEHEVARADEQSHVRIDDVVRSGDSQ